MHLIYHMWRISGGVTGCCLEQIFKGEFRSKALYGRRAFLNTYSGYIWDGVIWPNCLFLKKDRHRFGKILILYQKTITNSGRTRTNTVSAKWTSCMDRSGWKDCNSGTNRMIMSVFVLFKSVHLKHAYIWYYISKECLLIFSLLQGLFTKSYLKQWTVITELWGNFWQYLTRKKLNNFLRSLLRCLQSHWLVIRIPQRARK